jgi:hypothetical protein
MLIEGTIIYAALAIVATMVALLGVVREFKFRRVVLVLGFLVTLPVLFVMTIDLLSRARPVELMLPFQRPDVETAQIMSKHFIEGERIYLVLMWDGLSYPRSYSWPWNQEMAEDIQKAFNDAQADGSEGVMIDNPFDPSLDEREHPFIHPLPVPSENITKPSQPPEIFEVPVPRSDNPPPSSGI